MDDLVYSPKQRRYIPRAEYDREEQEARGPLSLAPAASDATAPATRERSVSELLAMPRTATPMEDVLAGFPTGRSRTPGAFAPTLPDLNVTAPAPSRIERNLAYATDPSFAEEYRRQQEPAPVVREPERTIGALQPQNAPDVVRPRLQAPMESGLYNFTDQLTFGQSDYFADRAAAGRVTNPRASKAGEVAGIVLPDALLGYGFAGKAGRAAVRGFLREGGDAAAKAVARTVGPDDLARARAALGRVPFEVKKDAAITAGIGGAYATMDNEDAMPAGLGMAMFGFVPAPGRMGAVSPLRSALEEFSPKRTHTVKEWIDRIVDPKGNVKLRYSWTNPAGVKMEGTVARDEAEILVSALRGLGENETLSRDALIGFAESNAEPLVEQVRLEGRSRRGGTSLLGSDEFTRVRRALSDWKDDAARGLDETRARERANAAIAEYNATVVRQQEPMYDEYTSPERDAGRVRVSAETIFHEPRAAGRYTSEHWPRLEDEHLPTFSGSFDEAVEQGQIDPDLFNDFGHPWPIANAAQQRWVDDYNSVPAYNPEGAYGTMHTRHTIRTVTNPDGSVGRRFQVEEDQTDIYNDIRDRGVASPLRPSDDGIPTEAAPGKTDPSTPVDALPAVSEGTGARIRTIRALQQAIEAGVDEIAIAGPAEQVRRYNTDRVVYTPPAAGAAQGTLRYTDEAIGIDTTYTVDPKQPLEPQLVEQGFYDTMRNAGKRTRNFGPSGVTSMARRFAKAIASPGEEIALRADGMEAAYGLEGSLVSQYAREAKKHFGLDLTFVEDGKGSMVARFDPEQKARAQADLRESRDRGRGKVLYAQPAAVGFVLGGASAQADEEGDVQPLFAAALGGAVGGVLPSALGAAKRSLPVSKAMSTASRWLDFGGVRQRIADAAVRGGEVVEDYNWFDRVIERVAKSGHYLDRYGDQMAAGGLRPLQNPGVLVNRTKASQHIVEQALMGDGLRNLQGEVITGKSMERVVKDNLGTNPEDIKQGFAYLVAQRIKDRGPKAVGGNTQFYDDMVALANEQGALPQVQQFAQEWQSYVKGVMDYAVEAGLWTRQQANRFLESDALYVPLSRVVPEMGKQRGLGRGADFVNVDDGVYKMLGSERVVRDPALAATEYVARIIQRADHYRVGASLFDVAEKFGDDAAGIQRHFGSPPNGPVSGPGAFESLLQETAGNDPFANKLIWRNNPWTGEREFATVTDGSLHNTLLTLNRQVISDPQVRAALDFVLGRPKRLLTLGTTGTPTFTLGTNIARDVGTAFSQTQAGMTGADYFRGFGAAASGGRIGGLNDLAEVRQAGLGGVSAYGAPRSAAQYQRAIAPTTRTQVARNLTGRFFSSPIRAMEAFGEMSDLGPRAAEVIAAMRQNAGKVASGEWTMGDLRAHAAHLGRRATIDFSDRGSWAGIQFMGAYVPFFSAALNGAATYALAVRRNPKRAAAVQGTLALAAALGWAMKQRLGEDAKALENDRTAAERSTAIYFPVTDDVTIKLPVPQEVGIGAHAVTAFLDGVVDKDPKAGKYLAESLYRMLPPASVRNQPLVGAAWDIIENERQFTESPIEDMGMRGKLPEDRRRPETSRMYDGMASAARIVPGWENASPVRAEHVTQRMVGTAPKYVAEMAYDAITGGSDGTGRVPPQFLRSPVNPLRAFVAPRAPGATQSEIDMERLDNLYGMTQRSYNASLDANRQPTAATQDIFTSGRGEILYGKPVFEALRDSIASVRNERDYIMEAHRSGLYGGRYARTLLDQLSKREGAIYRSTQRDLNAVGIR